MSSSLCAENVNWFFGGTVSVLIGLFAHNNWQFYKELTISPSVMSPPVLGVEEGGESGVTKLTGSPSSQDSPDGLGLCLKERNYLGLSNCSSVDSSAFMGHSNLDAQANKLNLRATELRLGLPGSQSPERELDEKPLFPLLPSKDGVKRVMSGNKRGFSDAIDRFSDGKRMFHSAGSDDGTQSLGQGKPLANAGSNTIISSRPSGPQQPGTKEIPPKPRPEQANEINTGRAANSAPDSK